MRYHERRKMVAARRVELWKRWQEGESQAAIARALGVSQPEVGLVVHSTGGFPPPQRKRSRQELTLVEREEISRGLVAKKSCRQIAIELGRSASTISREVARNYGSARYRAAEADEAAWRRALRPKRCRLASHGRLRIRVAQKLSLNWSPQQIAGWLKVEYPNDESMHLSHETIYRSLFIQARGVLKKELVKHLRTRRSTRRCQKSSTKGQKRGQIIDAISIHERPAEVEDRAIPGHWEGDLIAGSNNTWIATLVERQSRFVMLAKLENKTSDVVVRALAKQIKKLPSTLFRSITWDRGTEMAKHKDFTVATDIQIYFCDPQHPWQRGTNENTNGLLRQYFPKGTDIGRFSQAELNRVALQLNQRPRETLGFRTPAYKLYSIVQ